MFSGLTNQMSNWMGKKNEEGEPEIHTEEKQPPAGEADINTSPTKSAGKLDMLAGVKSQMSGWLSGGIPGLNRAGGQGELDAQGGVAGGAGAGAAGTVPAQPPQESQPVIEGKDDDASSNANDLLRSATGGADSQPESPGGSPTDDKTGQEAFGAVSTKALAGAKSLGGFLYSAVNKASKSVVEASVKIKKSVEENRLIAELNKEQEAFIASKPAEKGEAVAPWVGAPNEDALREECLSLSTDQRNFLRAPPEGVEFNWDFEAIQPVAKATLALDPNLEKMRFQLVPKVISEENFWRNYFYRVSVLRQSHELNAMADQTESNVNQKQLSSESADQVQVTTGQETSGNLTTSSNNTLADSPGHEFVSDSMRVSDTDLEEVREGMKKLGMQPPKEEDWERELEAELKDYEVVTSGEEKHATVLSTTVSTDDPTNSAVVTVDKDDWEKQIDELLANEDEDLK